MKKTTATLFLFLCFLASQAQSDFSSVKLKNMSGKTVDFSDLVNQSKDTMVVLSFWATWCVPCLTELDNINDVYEQKQALKPFKLIAISIDDTRTAKRVKPFIAGKGWRFDVLLDTNSDLKRELNITDVPHVVIMKNAKIVYQHTGYIAGEEDNLFEAIRTL
jgi:peroxiredoxin